MNVRQEKFVHLYILYANATRAAIGAGYSERTAHSIGQENLKKPEIKAAIEAEQERWRERIGVTTERVLAEYARLAFSDMRQFTEWGPQGVTWKSSEELEEEAAACVAEVSETVSEGGRTRRFKLHDKVGALRDLGKHLQLFIERKEISGPNGGPIPLETLDRILNADEGG